MSSFTRYVAQSPENARRFHEHAICDFIDLLKKLENLKPLEETVAQGKAQLGPYMKVMEQVTDEDSYLRVSKIADALGEKILYDISNRYFSKFVHLTSLSIQAKKNADLVNLAIQGIVRLALHFMQVAFPALIKCVDALPPATG